MITDTHQDYEDSWRRHIENQFRRFDGAEEIVTNWQVIPFHLSNSFMTDVFYAITKKYGYEVADHEISYHHVSVIWRKKPVHALENLRQALYKREHGN